MAHAGVLRSVDGLAFAQLCEDQALLDTLRYLDEAGISHHAVILPPGEDPQDPARPREIVE